MRRDLEASNSEQRGKLFRVGSETSDLLENVLTFYNVPDNDFSSE
jgi:hypothetical protein